LFAVRLQELMIHEGSVSPSWDDGRKRGIKMFKSWFNSLKSKNVKPKWFSRNFAKPEIVSLEERVTPAQTVSITYLNGILTLKSDTLAGETNTFQVSQITQTGTKIQFTGSGGTIFNSTVPNTVGNGTANAEIDAKNLANFNQILVQGGLGDDITTFGTLDGNILASSNQNNFSFEVDVVTFSGGGSSGGDTLNINGPVTIKQNGTFTTDSTSTVQPNANLDSLIIGPLGGIYSSGSGNIRLIADGLNTSDLTISSGGTISTGSGSVYLRSGASGNIRTNGNAITTIGGPITFDSNVILESSTVFSTGLGLGGIDFNGLIAGSTASSENLTINSSGSLVFLNSVGSSILPLGSITLGSQQPSSVTFSGDVFAKSLQATVQGAFTSSGTLSLNDITGLTLTTTGASGTVTFGSPGTANPVITTTNKGSVIINNSGALTLNGNLNLYGAFSQTGSGVTNLGSAGVIGQLDINTNDSPILFTSAVLLNQDISVNSNSLGLVGFGKDIIFSSTIDGANNIQTTSGTGNTTISGNIGSSVSPLAILVNSTNKLTVSGTVNADSFTVTSATNAVQFKGVQTYDQLAGLNITTSTANGAVSISGAVTASNNAQININNSGLLIISNGANLTTNTSNLSLGGSGGGKILIAANLTSSTGNILVQNPVELQSDISVTNNGGSVVFSQTVDSNSGGAKSLNLIGNNSSPFTFSAAVGSSYGLGTVTVNSSSGVMFNSTLNAGAISILDSINSVVVSGNLFLTGNLTTTLTTNAYNLSLLGLNNQVNGSAVLAHLGTTTLGNLNSASFLFSSGLAETSGAGITAQGSIISGSALNISSDFTVGGNNVGQVTLDTTQDSVFGGRIFVQPNERITKNGIGGLRFLSNTGAAYQGSLFVNNGTITAVDDFSSIINTTISGGTISGTGTFGPVFGLAGLIAPGDPIGNLTVGNTSINSLSTFNIQAGTIVGSNDSLTVNGSISLSNATLSVTTGQNLVLNQVIPIIINDGSDAIVGTFNGLAEGSTFTSGVYTFQISYVGGNGNDATLKVTNTVIPPTPVVPGIQQVFATAANAGGGPMVTVNFPNGNTVSFFAYSPSFTGGVRIAMGDVNGDGYSDLVTGVGVGGGPHIKVWDITSGAPIQVASFFAFESAFTGGLYLGVGNLNGDAYGDIIVGAGPGGGPRVTAFAGAQAFAINQNQVLTNFFAYSDVFRGGVTVAAADRTGDGVDEIVTGAGYGGGPNVSVFQLIQTTPNQFNPQLIQNFFVFDTTFTGGIFVAGGRFSNGTNSSGQILDEIFVGTGAGTKATVAVAFGTGGFYYLNPFGNFQGGVTVGISSSSATLGGTNYLMAAAGPGGGPQVNIYDNSFGLVDSFFALNPEMRLGVFANTTIL